MTANNANHFDPDNGFTVSPGTYFSAPQLSFALERNRALLHSNAPETYVGRE
jgi:hypothetical protein